MAQKLSIVGFKDKKVCPYNTLCHHLQCTRGLRKTKFMYIFTNKYQQCAPITDSRWVKIILFSAGINFKKYPSSIPPCLLLLQNYNPGCSPQIGSLENSKSKSSNIVFRTVHILKHQQTAHSTEESVWFPDTTHTWVPQLHVWTANPSPAPAVVAHINYSLRNAIRWPRGTAACC